MLVCVWNADVHGKSDLDDVTLNLHNLKCFSRAEEFVRVRKVGECVGPITHTKSATYNAHFICMRVGYCRNSNRFCDSLLSIL